MTHERTSATLRGFASMDIDKQREIARKGGANVPHEKRSFALDRALAAAAGRKGGRAVAPQARSFSSNRGACIGSWTQRRSDNAKTARERV